MICSVGLQCSLESTRVADCSRLEGPHPTYSTLPTNQPSARARACLLAKYSERLLLACRPFPLAPSLPAAAACSPHAHALAPHEGCFMLVSMGKRERRHGKGKARSRVDPLVGVQSVCGCLEKGWRTKERGGEGKVEPGASTRRGAKEAGKRRLPRPRSPPRCQSRKRLLLAPIVISSQRTRSVPTSSYTSICPCAERAVRRCKE